MDYIAYTDGSFKKVGEFECYASAGILAPKGSSDWTSFVQVGTEPDYLSYRNVAGELFAVMKVCEYCANALKLTPNDTLTIYHDYVGVNNWLKKSGEKDFWRCKRELTQAYRNYMYKYILPKFKLQFVHVYGHSGDQWNEYVDKLANDAIEKRLMEFMRTK